jgi:hypothetical protein
VNHDHSRFATEFFNSLLGATIVVLAQQIPKIEVEAL